MKPAWDKLMAEYEAHKTTLVADVDCTTGGKDLCETVGVQGFPTIKYGDPSDLEDYQGGRDFDALKKFADGLGPLCSVTNLDLCSAEKKKQIEEYMAMDMKTLEKFVESKEQEMKKISSDFDTFVEGLQKQYSDGNTQKDEGIKAIKEAGLGLAKAVRASLKKGKDEL